MQMRDGAEDEGLEVERMIVHDLTDEPNCVCFAMVSGKGMVITWGKQDPSGPAEGLHIPISKEKMLELARAILDACKEEKEAWEDFARTHPEVVDWKVELTKEDE